MMAMSGFASPASWVANAWRVTSAANPEIVTSVKPPQIARRWLNPLFEFIPSLGVPAAGIRHPFRTGGNALLADVGPCPRVLEVNPTGQLIVEFPTQCQLTNFHLQTRMNLRPELTPALR